MIVTGIIIVAVAVILMIVSMAGVFVGAAGDSDKTAVGSLVLYFLCAICYVAGLAITAIGIVQELT